MRLFEDSCGVESNGKKWAGKGLAGGTTKMQLTLRPSTTQQKVLMGRKESVQVLWVCPREEMSGLLPGHSQPKLSVIFTVSFTSKWKFMWR